MLIILLEMVEKLFIYHILKFQTISDILGYFLAKTNNLLNYLLKGTLDYLYFYKNDFMYWTYKDLHYAELKKKYDACA